MVQSRVVRQTISRDSEQRVRSLVDWKWEQDSAAAAAAAARRRGRTKVTASAS
jgi:hypothetical protein